MARLGRLRERLAHAMARQLEARAARLARGLGLLRALGPQATLERGYAIVTDPAGRIVRDGASLVPGERVDTRVARGGFTATVTVTRKEGSTDEPAS